MTEVISWFPRVLLNMNGRIGLHSCIAQVDFERKHDKSFFMIMNCHQFISYFYIHHFVSLHIHRVYNMSLNSFFISMIIFENPYDEHLWFAYVIFWILIIAIIFNMISFNNL